MPSLAQGAAVELTFNEDSTLVIQNPGGYAIVEAPIGTTVWGGGEANKCIDVSSTARITAVSGGLNYETSADPTSENEAASTNAGAQPSFTLVSGFSGEVTVRMRTPSDSFSVIVLYQYDQWDNKMPLGYMVCNRGRLLSKTFTLESDAVQVSWEPGGRYYAQSVAGIPSEVGTLTYVPHFAAPESVEFL